MTDKSLNPERESTNCRLEATVGGSSSDSGSDKSLFICSFEQYEVDFFGYVVRSINLGDLLSSPVKLKLRDRAYIRDKDLPYKGGCGVLGSKIVFVSGLIPSYGFCQPFNPHLSKEAYAFDIHDAKQGIVKMEGTLNGGKQKALMVEFGGKLYVRSCVWMRKKFPSFEVFDPEHASWSVLPNCPDEGRLFSYAISGTKLFMSSRNGPGDKMERDPSIWSYDIADQDPQWRRIPTMGPFPFIGQALAIEHSNTKLLLFSLKEGLYDNTTSLVVHLMSLDENKESLTEILKMNLPDELRRQPEDSHFFHLGGNNVCLVTTSLRLTDKEFRQIKTGIKTVRGAAIPFQFEFDMNNRFTVQFQPPRFFEYHTSPDCHFLPQTLGCFVL